MIKSIIEFHVDMVEDGWLGRVIFCFVILLYMFIALFIFQALDSGLGDSRMMDGRVTGKEHIPGHMVITNTGKTTISTWVPDSYSVDAYFHEIDETITCSVGENAYEMTDYTSSITASISRGYFTESYYCE